MKKFCVIVIMFSIFSAATIFAVSPACFAAPHACIHSSNSSNCFSCHSKVPPRKPQTIPTVSKIRALGGSWLITKGEATKVVEDCYGPPDKTVGKWCLWDISSANHLRFCGFFGDVAIDILGTHVVFTGARVLTWDIKNNIFYERDKLVKFSWRYETLFGQLKKL